MSDITVTAANVIPAVSARKATGIAGATITAGQPLYQDSADSFSLKPAQADTAAKANTVGIALHGASDGQTITYITEGDLTAGGTLVVGMVYVVSDAAAGGIAPYGDLLTDDFVSVLGVAISASVLRVKLQVSGVDKP